MDVNTLPFLVDRYDESEGNAVLVGQRFSVVTEDGPKTYTMVKVTSAITAAGGTFLSLADVEAGESAAKAAGETVVAVAGLVDSAIGDVPQDAFLLVQTGGFGEAIANDAVAAGAALLTANAGRVDDAAAAFDDTVAYAVDTAAALDDPITVKVVLTD